MVVFLDRLKNPFQPLKNFHKMNKIVRVDDLQVFVTSASAGSFSAAARILNISPALASGAIQRLEGILDVRLFVRSTRSLRMSDDGERYLPHAMDVLSALDNGEQALATDQAEIAGTLKLSMPSDIGRNVILPWLDEFQALYPKLRFQLRISDQVADLYSEHLDATLRYGQLADSSLVSLSLAPLNRRTLCASPGFLREHGYPSCPEELVRFNCLRYVMGEQTHDRWVFEENGETKSIHVNGDRTSNDADVVRRWAVAGRGIIYKSRIDVLEDIKAGRLIELLPEVLGQPAPLQLVCAHRKSLTLPIQKLKQFLGEKFSAYEG